MQVTITLDPGAGADLGPFNLTANTGTVSPSTATRAQLLAGLEVTVDNAATSVTVTSTGNCTNNTTATITGIPAGSCTIWDVVVTQADLDEATGNTDTSQNGSIYVDYTRCDNEFIVQNYGGPGTYQICVTQAGGGGIQSPVIYIYKNNQPESPVNGSAVSDTSTPCT